MRGVPQLSMPICHFGKVTTCSPPGPSFHSLLVKAPMWTIHTCPDRRTNTQNLIASNLPFPSLNLPSSGSPFPHTLTISAQYTVYMYVSLSLNLQIKTIRVLFPNNYSSTYAFLPFLTKE